MAQFRAVIKGSRGEVSRLGSKSGITAYINGWNQGVIVRARVNEGGEERIYIYASGGSNGGPSDGLLGAVINGHFFTPDALREF
jgi:hypothetical protein